MDKKFEIRDTHGTLLGTIEPERQSSDYSSSYSPPLLESVKTALMCIAVLLAWCVVLVGIFYNSDVNKAKESATMVGSNTPTASGAKTNYINGHVITLKCDDMKKGCGKIYTNPPVRGEWRSKAVDPILAYQISWPESLKQNAAHLHFVFNGEGCDHMTTGSHQENCETWDFEGDCSDARMCKGTVSETVDGQEPKNWPFSFVWQEFGKRGTGRVPDLNIQFSVYDVTGKHVQMIG